MPTHIYLRGGGKLSLKGDTISTAVVKSRFGRVWSGVAVNGHEITMFKKDVLAYELQSEAEVKEIEEKEKKVREEQANASKCRRCGSQWPHGHDFCGKCGSPLVKKQAEEPRLEVPGRRP